MRKITHIIILCCTCMGCGTSSYFKQINSDHDLTEEWNYFIQQKAIDDLVKELSVSKKSVNTIFFDANVVTMKDSTVLYHRNVWVKDGRIFRITAITELPMQNESFNRVDCSGKFLLPGLSDAHVHVSQSNDEKLLNILTGITTVREMAGFPWMIEYRKRIMENQLLAPTIYVAGTMLNYFDMGMYTQVIKKGSEARKIVKIQKDMGYDFIKVHNVVPLPYLKIIGEEAKKNGIFLVGHIPHDVTIQEAVSAGMRTLEHFKGYYLDNNLTMTKEDYVSVTSKFDSVWLCPTLAPGYRQSLRGNEAEYLINNEEDMKYVPASLKEKWLKASLDTSANSYHLIDSLCKVIFQNLLHVHPKWLAGTDNNGSNPNMVPGFILHEELRLMKLYGLSDYEILKAATINLAEALGKQNEFGTIEKGKRADLLLINENPLKDVSAVSREKSVMVRGIWFPASEIKNLFAKIKEIYQTNSKINEASVSRLYSYYMDNSNKYLVKPISIMRFSELLAKSGLNDKALALLKENIKRYPYFYSYDALAKEYLNIRDTVNAINNYKLSIDINQYDEDAIGKLKQLGQIKDK